MGVKGLTRYIEENCPASCRYTVNLKQLAADYIQNHGRNPVIVMDGLGLLRKLYGGLEYVYGGQWWQYYQKIKDIVTIFRSAKIDLVIIFDGVVGKTKRSEWVKRKQQHCNATRKVFDIIKGEKQPTYSQFVMPCNLGTFTMMAFKYLGVTVYQSIVEADLEIAHYCKNHDCFGIIGNDSDFVIFNTCSYFALTAGHSLKSLKLFRYDIPAVCRHLGIEQCHLPLLACLLGNDIIEYTHLVDFHRRLQDLAGEDELSRYDVSCDVLVPTVARYIAGQNISVLNSEVTANIALSVFGDKTCESGRLSELMEKVVKMYQLEDDVDQLDEVLNNPTMHTLSECSKHASAVPLDDTVRQPAMGDSDDVHTPSHTLQRPVMKGKADIDDAEPVCYNSVTGAPQMGGVEDVDYVSTPNDTRSPKIAANENVDAATSHDDITVSTIEVASHTASYEGVTVRRTPVEDCEDVDDVIYDAVISSTNENDEASNPQDTAHTARAMAAAKSSYISSPEYVNDDIDNEDMADENTPFCPTLLQSSAIHQSRLNLLT